MSPKRLLLLILCLFSCQIALLAQDQAKVKIGRIIPTDFTLPVSAIIDSNTSAVILSNKGSIHFVGNKQGWFSYVFRKQVRMKIINKSAFDLATVSVRLYSEDEKTEKMDNLSASTFNLEDGKVVENRLNKTDVFENRIDKNYTEKRFTLPAVKEGSIIEYAYDLISDFYFNLPAWAFQSEDYPCLWSEYDVTIPQTLFYVVVKQGIHDFVVDKAESGFDSYLLTTKHDNEVMLGADERLRVNASTIKHHWAMKDIPAFRVENYISSPANYIDKIEFQLSKTYNGEDSKDVMNTWAKATEELLGKEDFGKPLSEQNDWLDPLLNSLTANKPDRLQKARAIYTYLKNQLTCTDPSYPYITTTLQDVLKKRNGSVGDLNLLLVAMLRKTAISADPVLLSTREHGLNLSKYPVVNRLNYIIVRAMIGGKVYYLDATHRQLGFGQLAENCYNGHARIINAKDSGSVYFYPDSLKDSRTTMVVINSNEKGEIGGSYQSTLGLPGSYELRTQVGETGEKNYFEGIGAANGEDVEISNTGIDSLDQPEVPVNLHYDLLFKQTAGSDLLYFYPLFGEACRINPFKALDRKYPVEMPYALDHTYILNMEIPTGYTVDELPKSTRVALNGQEGMFEYLVENDGNMIQLRARLRLAHTEFAPEDYGSLRDFYGLIVKKESEQIVLKKK